MRATREEAAKRFMDFTSSEECAEVVDMTTRAAGKCPNSDIAIQVLMTVAIGVGVVSGVPYDSFIEQATNFLQHEYKRQQRAYESLGRPTQKAAEA